MASGNHVEELESRVRELEATVDGLTDELVECKVRIRELENVVDAEIGLDNIDTVTGSDAGAATSQTDSTDDAASDVQVADGSTPGPEAAEASKSEGSEEADKTEADEGDSDIIIA